MQFLEQWDAPAAAGSGPQALADLAGVSRSFPVEVVGDFAQGDLKAEANGLVSVHALDHRRHESGSIE